MMNSAFFIQIFLLLLKRLGLPGRQFSRIKAAPFRRSLFLMQKEEMFCMAEKKVAIIMGSDSDFPKVVPAIKRLKTFGVPVEVHVMSAHRTPQAAADFSEKAAENGIGVIIAAAGKAAHLGGVLAAHTTLPVIGIPVKSSTLDGLDALLATVQMPSGIPVATVAIDGADNAAILAVQMLALSDKGLAAQLVQMKKEMAEGVAEKDAAIQQEVKCL